MNRKEIRILNTSEEALNSDDLYIKEEYSRYLENSGLSENQRYAISNVIEKALRDFSALEKYILYIVLEQLEKDKNPERRMRKINLDVLGKRLDKEITFFEVEEAVKSISSLICTAKDEADGDLVFCLIKSMRISQDKNNIEIEIDPITSSDLIYTS